MCRLIAITGPQTKQMTEPALRQFGMLAENGNIPPGTAAGHKDGWGLLCYQKEEVSFFAKNPLSASEDPKFELALTEASKASSTLLLGHLRKASRGGIMMENTQPYVFGSYSFAHNGTVRNYQELVLEPEYAAARKGTTDSEAVFLWLVQTIRKKGDFLGGFLEGMKTLRGMDYSAANILMSDGNLLLAAREANENDDAAKKDNLCDAYYTLLQGKDASGKTRFICSQKFDVSGITWTEIPNHSVLAIDLKDLSQIQSQI